MKGLKEYTKELDACVRCGACRSVCPTFGVIGREPVSPRGKLAMMEARSKGEERFGEAYLSHIGACTLCGACMENCPKGVDVPTCVLAARAEAIREGDGSPLASFVVKNLLNSERLMPWAMKVAARLKVFSLVLKSSTVESGLLSRFPLPLIGDGRLIPKLPETFFLDSPEVSSLSEAGGKKDGVPTVGFFAGCGVNYLLPGIGEATLRVLKKAGAKAVVPSGQICCGMPALSMGDVETAKSLALKNIEAFEDEGLDYITTSCATCTHALKSVFMKVLADEGPEMRERVEKFSSRVRDITELLAGELSYNGGGEGSLPRGTPVTYHDPCHLGRFQGIREEPRALLEGAGFALAEMEGPSECCGLGGGLAFSDYDTSSEIAGKKAESIRATGAPVVATACPGCIVQIKDGLHRSGVEARVAHVVELL
ncbi:MAG: (Fe-S)-binding protein [Thermodesulfobacteriota bacterium]